jgi:hypothetical protein
MGVKYTPNPMLGRPPAKGARSAAQVRSACAWHVLVAFRCFHVVFYQIKATRKALEEDAVRMARPQAASTREQPTPEALRLHVDDLSSDDEVRI